MQVLRSCLQSTSICLQIYTILANKISRHEKKALNTEQPPFFAILGNRVSKVVSKGLIFRMFRQSEKIRKAENPDKSKVFGVFAGVPGGIRTHGLSLRRRTLYPAELQRLILN